jgi:hypothetical protein
MGGEMDSVHVKRIYMKELVGYVCIVRVDPLMKSAPFLPLNLLWWYHFKGDNWYKFKYNQLVDI